MTARLINGRYRSIRELGHGGMGKVYLVEDTHRDDTPMALKTMLANRTDAHFLDSFRTEFAELARLRHPNVAAAYDFGRIEASGEHYFTTEFVDGVDLYAATRRTSFDQLLDITTQVLRGLEFLHDHGLLHNDLKPANVLLGDRESGSRDGRRGDLGKLESTVFGLAGCVKLIDFGLISATGVAWERVRGTPRYMSPERIRCQPADSRSDLYSLGCVLYLLASRRYAFEAKDSRELLAQHLKDAAPRLETVSRTVPQAFADFVHRLLEKSPECRFATAGEAIDFLNKTFQPEPAPTGRPARAPAVTVGSLRHRDKEIEELALLCDEVFDGNGVQPCAVISGEAGVGKTRFVEELKGRVQTLGGAFVHLDEAAVSRHLGPVVKGLLEALRTSGAKDLDQISQSLLGGDCAPEDRDGESDLAERLERFVLHYAQKVPILLFLDDFHAVSEPVRLFSVSLVQATSELLARVEAGEAGCRPRLMIVIARRPLRRRGELGLDGQRRFDLDPFDEEQTKNFLRLAFSQDAIPDEVLAHLVRAAGGNPRFLLELAQHLVEKSHVTHDGTGWVFPPTLESIPLPDSLRDAVESRVNALGTDATTILQWLTIAHAPLSVRALQHCTHLETERIELVLGRLRQGGFVQKERADDESALEYWRLTYPDLRKRFLGELDSDRQELMHQRLAQAAEEDGAIRVSSGGELAEIVALHWLEAENLPAFLRFAPEAAEHLRQSGNFARAVEYHARVSEALPDDAVARKIRSLVQLSEMHEFLWQLDSSTADLRAVLEAGEGVLKPSDQAALHRRLASLALSSGEPRTALRHVREATRLHGASPTPVQRLSLQAIEAWGRWLQGDLERATERLVEADLNLMQCEDATPKELPAVLGARNWLASLRYHLGQSEEAVAMQRGNLAIAAQLDHEQARASCLCSLGGMLLDIGEHAEASERLEESLEIGKRLGDRRTLARARERLGEYHLLHGSVKRALQLTQVGLQDAEALRHRQATADALRMLGRIYMRVGQYDDALEVLKRAIALQRDDHDLAGAPLSRTWLARLYTLRGDASAASRQIGLAREESKRQGLARVEAICELRATEAVLAEKSRVPSDDLLRCRQTLDQAGLRRELIDHGILRARSALAGGDIEVARQSLKSVEDWLRSIGTEEQQAEIAWLDAMFDVASEDMDAARVKLTELRRFAKNTVFPELAQRCRDQLARIRALATG